MPRRLGAVWKNGRVQASRRSAVWEDLEVSARLPVEARRREAPQSVQDLDELLEPPRMLETPGAGLEHPKDRCHCLDGFLEGLDVVEGLKDPRRCWGHPDELLEARGGVEELGLSSERLQLRREEDCRQRGLHLSVECGAGVAHDLDFVEGVEDDDQVEEGCREPLPLRRLRCIRQA